MTINRNIRVFVDNNLSPGMKIILPERLSHYLCSVMRCKAGERIKCFNNHSGEFFCDIDISDEKATTIEVEDKVDEVAIEEDDVDVIEQPVQEKKHEIPPFVKKLFGKK
jgi:16S rRNA U1498 N3-methylase RsmE